MKAAIKAATKWLHFAWLNTRRNGRRSAVTLAIAALGTAALLLAGGFAIFTYQSLAQSSARSTGHLVIATAEQFTKDEDQPLQHGLEAWEDLRQRLRLDADVRQVLPRVEFTGLISNGDKSTVMMAAGIDPDAEFAIKGPFLSIKQGAVLSGDQRMAVMLGEGLAKSLKAKPGDSLTLLASTTAGAMNAIDVQVQGVFSTGIAEMDKRSLYIDVKSAQALLDTTRVSSLGVFLKDMEATDGAQARIRTLAPTLTVRTWLDQAMFYHSVKQLYDRIFGALGLIIAVIVIFVVGNAMAMAIIERTREIGTLRALGTLPGQLQRTLALEGMLLGGGGALLGAALSLGLSLLLMVMPVNMPPPPGYSKGYPLNIAIDGPLYAITLGAMLLLALLASAWVARKTVRLPIVTALAHT
ncbi:ABC transporter permease [Pelomonas sp. V22]|uniref:ABC transporter permease n=1 Tax=Pelomonas sp. V22 TaxID=2822139 RepID=UPI0024A95ED3|nr:FtsX-like permease family protein [Pelomonas sp. V22]MDI4632451.1 ABC transporter permease [Pelomonas sp. V22]